MKDTIYYPLTSPQLSIWYTERMYSGTSISNVAGSLRIKDKVDIELLDKAINLFIKNNDGMRLRICLDDEGTPKQYVSEYQYRKIEVKDFSKLDDPIKAMQEWDRQETLKPFQLLDSDLYRFSIIKLSETDAGFYILTHHIISDAWNMSFLGSTIVEYYCKLTKDEEDPTLYSAMPSYISYIKNEKQYLQSNRYVKDKEYWEKTFESLPEFTVLKTRKSNKISTKSKRKTFIAPKKFTNKLRDYCIENKITPYPLFLSALSMYTNRITEKEDIILGTPILNRLNHSDKNTAGMFISTIPLRINTKSETSFKDLSQNIMELCLSTYRHQRYPYERILKFVREKHGFTDNLYDIVLSYQNSKFDKTHDVEYFTRWHFNEHQSNSLTIHINDRDEEGVLIIDYDYHSDLYYDKEIEFIHQHILSLLWHALDNPNNLICKIEMLTESEKKKILYDFNNTYADYPRDKTIHQLFEEQVERTPDNIAVVFEDKHLTYKELNQKANSLANTLRNKGVKPDEIVGIMVPRSLEMIIGILAILKAGGAYLPIEPEYPDDRVKFILKDTGMKIILTDTNSVNKITDCISINIENKLNYDRNMNNPENINTSKDLAYIIYTSGSTGQPKGVMVEHASVINFVEAVTKILDFSINTVVLSTATFCFDIFVTEVLTSILRGSKVILANGIEQSIPVLTGNLIYKHKANKIITTPGRMRLLLTEKSNFSKLESIEEILLAGESFPLDLLKELRANFKAKIYNGYGPTESTMGVSIKELTNEKRISVGKPISNIKLYVFDKYMKLMPIGQPGELCIGGDGLARGYLNRPELTSKYFIQNPFNSRERLYKTGDVAKWLSYGEIDILGRIDSQVKINGCRIELDEIKKNILNIPGVLDAAVINRVVMNNKQALCAYLKIEGQMTSVSVRDYLSKTLPDYMIPAYISFVQEIPLNSNGKLDIEKLPNPLMNKKITTYVAPRNRTEAEIKKIWEKVLKKEEIGVNDVIFEHGADSLDIIAVSTAIYKKYSITLPVVDIRDVNTICKMASYVDKERLMLSLNNNNLCLLKKGRKNLFFIHAGNGEISNYTQLSQNISDEFSCWGIRMCFDDYSPYNTTIHELALKYVNYITQIQPKGPYYLAGWCIGGTIAFEMANILEKRNEKNNYLGLFNSIAPQHWKGTELFTPAGEIDFIRKFLKFDYFTFDLNHSLTINDVWNCFINKIRKLGDEQIEEIKRRIPNDMRLVIPRFNESSIEEIIRYVNCMRTLHIARAIYYPERKLKAKVHFVNAIKDTIIKDKYTNIELWNKYCILKAIQSDVDADHYSLFQSPNVEKVGNIMNDVIKSSEGIKQSI